MLQVTREAVRQLHREREERGFDPGTGARFVRTASGVGLTFASEPGPLDRAVGDGDLPIYLDEDLAVALDRAIIDVRTERGETRLVILPQLMPG
jgi:hypothetical protein